MIHRILLGTAGLLFATVAWADALPRPSEDYVCDIARQGNCLVSRTGNVVSGSDGPCQQTSDAIKCLQDPKKCVIPHPTKKKLYPAVPICHLWARSDESRSRLIAEQITKKQVAVVELRLSEFREELSASLASHLTLIEARLELLRLHHTNSSAGIADEALERLDELQADIDLLRTTLTGMKNNSPATKKKSAEIR